MSEEDPFTIHEKLAELIIINNEFENEHDIDDFLELLRESMVIMLDGDYEPTDTESSTDDLEGECNIELVISEVDSEGFHEIVENEIKPAKVGWKRNKRK